LIESFGEIDTLVSDPVELEQNAPSGITNELAVAEYSVPNPTSAPERTAGGVLVVALSGCRSLSQRPHRSSAGSPKYSSTKLHRQPRCCA
jgi:hypothetical protein